MSASNMSKLAYIVLAPLSAYRLGSCNLQTFMGTPGLVCKGIAKTLLAPEMIVTAIELPPEISLTVFHLLTIIRTALTWSTN